MSIVDDCQQTDALSHLAVDTKFGTSLARIQIFRSRLLVLLQVRVSRPTPFQTLTPSPLTNDTSYPTLAFASPLAKRCTSVSPLGQMPLYALTMTTRLVGSTFSPFLRKNQIFGLFFKSLPQRTTQQLERNTLPFFSDQPDIAANALILGALSISWGYSMLYLLKKLSKSAPPRISLPNKALLTKQGPHYQTRPSYPIDIAASTFSSPPTVPTQPSSVAFQCFFCASWPGRLPLRQPPSVAKFAPRQHRGSRLSSLGPPLTINSPLWTLIACPQTLV